MSRNSTLQFLDKTSYFWISDMFRWCWGTLLFLFWLAPLVVVAVDVEQTLREFDVYSARNGSTYEDSIEIIEGLLRQSSENGDAALRARILIRMAHANLIHAQWSPEWESWRDEAVEISETLPVPHIARAEVLMLSGFIRGMYLNEIPQGIEDLEMHYP